jgi:pre-mRNA-processing factor 40
MPWRKAVAFFEGDTRFEGIPEREREDLYEEYLVEKEKSEKEAVRQARRENMKKFRLKLEADSSINANSQWRKVCIYLDTF